MKNCYYQIKVTAMLYNSSGLKSLLDNLYIELDGTEEYLKYEISQNGEVLAKSTDHGCELTQKGEELVASEAESEKCELPGYYNRHEYEVY